jgi:type VI secretion system protein ImpL
MALADSAKKLASPRLIAAAAAIVVIAALIAAMLWTGAFSALIHSRWLPEIAIAVAAAIALAAVVWGLPWYRERAFLRNYGSDYRAAAGGSPQEFQARFADALRRLRQLPRPPGDDEAVYALPWFLIIGPGETGKTAALKASGMFSPLTSPPADGGTVNFDWWVSNNMLAIDTAGRYAIAPDATRDRAEWYRLLRLIRHYRAREPLNGIVAVIAADGLMTRGDEELRREAGQMRDRIEEAMRELGAVFPVYALVTKCDLLEGFSDFFGQLPERVRADAVGYAGEPPAGSDAGADREQRRRASLREGLDSIYQRLGMLRLALLNGETAEERRQPVFCFPEEFSALEARAGIFLEPLLSEDVRYHTPLFRGIYFAGARGGGASVSAIRRQLEIAEQPAPLPADARQDYFLRDFFDLVLPRDRALARGGGK